ncbi:MAG: hypothetical protein ABI579_07875, partial [Candidatus Sumerlaeota bacterium]
MRDALPPLEWKRRVAELAPWIVVFGIFLAHQFVWHGGLYLPSDDSYIYLGYVKMATQWPPSLFSYNVGEHSAGTTGSLYYYLLIPVCGILHLVSFPFIKHSTALVTGIYITNAMMWFVAASLFIGCWKRLTGRLQPLPFATSLALCCLFCANRWFMWGMFGGLENPLTVTLALLIVRLSLGRQPTWLMGSVCAAAVGSRPELLPTVGMIAAGYGAIAFAGKGSPAARRFRGAASSLAAFSIVLFLIIFPCWVYTGRLFPSALGSRLHLNVFTDFAGMRAMIVNGFLQMAAWKTGWLTALFVLLAVALYHAPAKRQWTILIILLLLLVNFWVRATFGLFDFNVQDRYISWVWVLYALGIAVCMDPLLCFFYRSLARFYKLIPCVLLCVGAIIVAQFPFRRFLEEYRTDVREM